MKIFRVQIFVVILCGYLFPTYVHATSDATVLIIHSYHQEYAWTKKENDGFVQTLNNILPETYIDYQTEYLDTKRVALDQGYQEHFYEYLKYKYSDYFPDLIFSSDDNALMFLLKYKNRLFKGVPVVFCGVNNLDIEEKINRLEYTGIFEKKEIIPNLNIVNKVLKNFSKLLLVGDGSSTDQAIVKHIVDDIQSRPPGIEYQVLSSSDFPALINQLKSVGNGLVLLTTIGEMKDSNGKVLPLKKALEGIVHAGDFIIIAMEDVYMEQGVLGGYVTSGYAQGKAAASFASRIIEGESPSSIELVKDSPNDYMFNYPQLEKLGIDISNVPQQSIIFDRPRSLYEDYKYEILSIFVFLIFQTIVIAILADNISRRKNAELALQASKDNLENKVIERTNELRQTNSELRISEAKHRALVNNIPGMVYIAKPDWSAEIISGSRNICGFSEKELNTEEKNWLTIIHNDDIGKIFEESREITHTKKSLVQRYRIIAKDGDIRWVEDRKTSLFSEKGDFLRIDGIIFDITERKQAELEKLEEKQKAETYLNLAGVMFIGLDIDGNINVANEKACQILEIEKNEVLGINWFDNFIPQNTRDDVYSVFEQLVTETIEPVEYNENIIVTKNGKEKHIVWHNTVIRDNNDSVIGVLASGDDVTEKKQLQSKLQQAQKMEAIGTLAGGIAHDFNNILGSILGYAEMVHDDCPAGSTIMHDVDQILKAGYRARDLVKQILAFSRQSETDQIPLQPAIIVREAINLLRSSLPSTIIIKERIDPTAGIILADPTQIHQMILNLCTNAFHAMETNGGTLTISLHKKVVTKEDLIKKPGIKPGSYIDLSIRDTGTGISPEIRERMFDPYFTTKEVGKGTGMGLAMVHGIVQSYGGTITCDSLLGEGSIFHITLPIVEDRSIQKNGQALPVLAGSERILLVDDEEMLVEIGKNMLERLGYRVTVRTSSIEALTIFRNQPDQFDLVITDQTMPGLTGIALAKRMLQLRPKLPIILCTGYSSGISEEKAKLMGIKGFALKPLLKNDIAKLIRKIISENI